MAVKGLQYQAMMTSLNGGHFGIPVFHAARLAGAPCSLSRYSWMVALILFLYYLTGNHAVGGLVFNIVFLGLLANIGI